MIYNSGLNFLEIRGRARSRASQTSTIYVFAVLCALVAIFMVIAPIIAEPQVELLGNVNPYFIHRIYRGDTAINHDSESMFTKF